jgi:hypothetical protein
MDQKIQEIARQNQKVVERVNQPINSFVLEFMRI